ncbi:MAG: DUF4369 domain-containing protein [Bacteroidales bacterium]|nr:DUF4369 domain-containing protein [Bacteroidales bacterium]MDD2425082.1 DUF4369 domain-containing protein [Bacteroidales bacterium]MDD3988585.1 DUF4369 domain-containing protein [Bacteroidales bacterium]MDD4639416.1 DUF4369 domain-containing protein [Bacteroidales bacterium]
MKTKINFFASLSVLLIISLTSCNNQSGFKLTGNIRGITDGTIYLTSYDGKPHTDTVLLKDGKFEFSANLTQPVQYMMMVEGRDRAYAMFYADNSKMTLTGHVDSLFKATITGGETQDLVTELNRRAMELQKLHKVGELSKELYNRGGNKVTPEREAEINSLMDKFNQEYEQLRIDFIKENPKAYYSAILVKQMTSGKSAEETAKYLGLLDKELETTTIVSEIRKNLDEMKKTEVSLGDFIKDAHNLAYKVDNSYAGKQYGQVVYLSVLSDNNICALKSTGDVLIIDPSGKIKKTFKTGMTSKPSAIATDALNNIFVLGSVTENKTVERRGKTVQVPTPVGVECQVFSTDGKKLREVKLEGIVTATGARVSDSTLVVADTRGRHIVIYNSQTGVKRSSIENLRTCCGILDFSIRKGNEVLVANLGAFRVNCFDYDAKPLFSFGQRGSGLDEFHGCCNPVSVDFLSNGGIVTVEKDPTRIKVYSAEGAKIIEGIDELVKGCSHIPVVVDKNNNIYLASDKEGIIKCITAI